jgi:thymidylate synthase
LTQRSADIALGVPYNIAGYAFILELVARLTGLKAGIFAHSLVDAHIYTRKIDGEKAEYDHIPGLLEQLKREPRPLPKLQISDDIQTLEDIEKLYTADTKTLLEKFELVGYQPYDDIKFKVAV